MTLKRILRGTAWVGGALLLVGGLGLGGLVWGLRASLPQLDGPHALPGLSAPVSVERDAIGVPALRASNRVDLARAMGFVHAQERFFQMDLLRRSGAGELSALLGPAVLPIDERVRLHGFRRIARDAVDRLIPQQRAILRAYTEGVNAGLAALGARPPEYLVLRLRPDAWREEDCFLVACAMFLTLQESTAESELRTAIVAQALPPAAVKFFFPFASEWDAALDGSVLPLPPMPEAADLDLSRGEVPPPRTAVAWAPEAIVGSNAWAVEGRGTTTGAAMIANDMHLDLGVPNIWFRMEAVWPGDSPIAPSHRLIGVTLPGVPVFAVASNGSIAWGFTNAYLDTSDLVELEIDPSDPGRYRTPDGWRAFDEAVEAIEVHGALPKSVAYQRTLWGPVLPRSAGPPRYALHWVPEVEGALNLDLMDLETATNVTEALAISPRCGAVPVQNFLVGDRTGAVGWGLIGRLPKRIGFDGKVPVSWADGRCRWDGWMESAALPQRLAAPGERLWTANNRILGSPGYLALGPWTTDFGARARSVRDDLQALPDVVKESDLFSIYHDNRSVLLERWQKLLLDTLSRPGGRGDSDRSVERWKEMTPFVADWKGRAAVDSVGYRLVRAFRLKVMDRILEPVFARCVALQPDLRLRSDRSEYPVWILLTRRPAHLLNPRFADYDALLADAVDSVVGDLDAQGLRISEATWGRRNTVQLHHPLSLGVPAFSRWLDMPLAELPGDVYMPRVQSPDMGSSERMVVSPGHEDEGLFNMPAGQGGHFLSPYYRAGHRAWVDAVPLGLLAGPGEHRLELNP